MARRILTATCTVAAAVTALATALTATAATGGAPFTGAATGRVAVVTAPGSDSVEGGGQVPPSRSAQAPASSTVPTATAPASAAADTTPATAVVPLSIEPAGRPGPADDPPSGITAAEPARLVIAAIDVDSDLERLGLLPDGSLEPPHRFGSAGWYEAGVVPGQPGPAVMAGHVDSRSGPAVFYRLAELVPGDLIEVAATDGSVSRFEVTHLMSVGKASFPTDAVYRATPGAELRLVTCGGDFDREVGHYRDNLIVFASLIGYEPPDAGS